MPRRAVFPAARHVIFYLGSFLLATIFLFFHNASCHPSSFDWNLGLCFACLVAPPQVESIMTTHLCAKPAEANPPKGISDFPHFYKPASAPPNGRETSSLNNDRTSQGVTPCFYVHPHLIRTMSKECTTRRILSPRYEIWFDQFTFGLGLSCGFGEICSDSTRGG